ncbi:hypothetical protein FGO68_gene5040 [Halteria grandinella]|uniref:Uncharacterized protein n=1 Tax=Halteria grandinella TaxID=5974 RepID=A0A8J8P8G9_HALGN|nr:hypothetical protein FGO68_gene5040 [Halteria grandinella]
MRHFKAEKQILGFRLFKIRLVKSSGGSTRSELQSQLADNVVFIVESNRSKVMTVQSNFISRIIVCLQMQQCYWQYGVGLHFIGGVQFVQHLLNLN